MWPHVATQRELPDIYPITYYYSKADNYYSYHFFAVSPLLQQPVEFSLDSNAVEFSNAVDSNAVESSLDSNAVEFSLDSNAVELSRWLKSKGLSEEECKIIRGTALRELLGCRAMSH